MIKNKQKLSDRGRFVSCKFSSRLLCSSYYEHVLYLEGTVDGSLLTLDRAVQYIFRFQIHLQILSLLMFPLKFVSVKVGKACNLGVAD